MSADPALETAAHARLVFDDCTVSLASNGHGAYLVVLFRRTSAVAVFHVLRVDGGRSVCWAGYAEVGGDRRLVAYAPDRYRGLVASLVARRAVEALKGPAEEGAES